MSLLNVTIVDVLKNNAENYPNDIAYIFKNISYIIGIVFCIIF